jgi:hypothetical protein
MEGTAQVTETLLDEMLGELGSTSDAVADTLRRAGFKGPRQEMTNCPVAKVVVSVSADTVIITRPSSTDGEYGDYLTSTEMPDPVAEFIQRFDSSIYSDLIEEDLQSESK